VDKRERIPEGAIAWKQGELMVDGEQKPVWKYIPPPWSQEKPITLYAPPVGAVRTEGRTPSETVQMIGDPGARVPQTISIDLGIADIEVSEHGRRIKFSGKGLETDVGGKPSPTQGMSIPSRGIRRKTVRYEVRRGKRKPKTRFAARNTRASLIQARDDITGL